MKCLFSEQGIPDTPKHVDAAHSNVVPARTLHGSNACEWTRPPFRAVRSAERAWHVLSWGKVKFDEGS